MTKKFRVVLRIRKLKHASAVTRALKHNFRVSSVKNADPAKADLNINSEPERFEEHKTRFYKNRPQKRCANAVNAVEYVITANRKYFQQNPELGDEYLKAALEYVKEKHGAENVVSASFHYDEAAPHLHIVIIPVTPDGRLSQDHFFGTPAKLEAMQGDFAEKVGSKFDLARGLKKSQAYHQEVSEHYADVNAEIPQIEFPAKPAPLPEKTLAESNPFSKAFADRRDAEEKHEIVVKAYNKSKLATYSQLIDCYKSVYKQAAQIPTLKEKIDELEQTSIAMQESYETEIKKLNATLEELKLEIINRDRFVKELHEKLEYNDKKVEAFIAVSSEHVKLTSALIKNTTQPKNYVIYLDLRFKEKKIFSEFLGKKSRWFSRIL